MQLMRARGPELTGGAEPRKLRGSPYTAASMRNRERFDAAKEGTPKKKNCNCKNSKCLKLYCECFASGRYCEGCHCTNCCNNQENEAIRKEAVEATLERNPNAFRPKIAASPSGAGGSLVRTVAPPAN
jgi:hypothetical protein